MMKDTKRAVYIAHCRKPPIEFHKRYYYVVLLMDDGRAVVRRLAASPTRADRPLPLECDGNVVDKGVFMACAQHIFELQAKSGRFLGETPVEQIVSLSR